MLQYRSLPACLYLVLCLIFFQLFFIVSYFLSPKGKVESSLWNSDPSSSFKKISYPPSSSYSYSPSWLFKSFNEFPSSPHSKDDSLLSSPNLTQHSPSFYSTHTHFPEIIQRDEVAKASFSICDVAFAIFHAPQHTTRFEQLRASWLPSLCGPAKSASDTSTSLYTFQNSQSFNIPTSPSSQISNTPNFRLWGSSTNTTSWEFDSQCSEEYNNLCCKTLAFIQRVRAEMPDKKWYVKCDDDTFFHTEHLSQLLRELDEEQPIIIGGETHVVLNDQSIKVKYGQRPLWGPEHGVTIKNNIVYPRGGAGYAISKGLMERLEENSIVFQGVCENLVAEDMAMGITAKELGGIIVPHVGFNFKEPMASFTQDWTYLNTAPIAWHMMQRFKTDYEVSTMATLQHILHASKDKNIDPSFTGYPEGSQLYTPGDLDRYQRLKAKKPESKIRGRKKKKVKRKRIFV